MADEEQQRDLIVEPIQPVGKKLDLGILLGIGGGFGALALGAMLEGSALSNYAVLSAAVIVFGGTMGATLGSVGLTKFLDMGRTMMKAATHNPINKPAAVRTLTGFAEKARREGLLVLEDDLQDVDSEFLRRGVQLVVDGTDPELVKDILQTEVDSVAEAYDQEAHSWMAMGGYSPTFGIIGTVMGLVLVLQNLSDPESLGPAIAVAFVATFYGVCFANAWYLPIGVRLKGIAEVDLTGREMMIEGILAIQSGDNPRIVEEKLLAFLEEDEKLAFRADREALDDFDLAA